MSVDFDPSARKDRWNFESKCAFSQVTKRKEDPNEVGDSFGSSVILRSASAPQSRLGTSLKTEDESPAP